MSASPKGGTGRRLLGQILKQNGVVREGQIQEALAEQRKHGGLIGQCLIQIGHCNSAQVARALAEQAGLEVADIDPPTGMPWNRPDTTLPAP